MLGAAAGTLAGWGAHVVRSAVSLPAAPAESASEPKAWQVSNREAKGDRLAPIQAAFSPGGRGGLALPPDPSATYALAATTSPTTQFDRVPNGAAAPMGAVDAQSAALAYAPEPVIATLPLPPKKPKHLPSPESGLLDDAHIAGIKGRLRLTAEQEVYWPAVESALREVGRTQLHQAMRRANGGKPQIDVNSPEVQRLIWAAMPLLRQLREDQKNEVRKLARVIGLHSVASQI